MLFVEDYEKENGASEVENDAVKTVAESVGYSNDADKEVSETVAEVEEAVGSISEEAEAEVKVAEEASDISKAMEVVDVPETAEPKSEFPAVEEKKTGKKKNKWLLIIISACVLVVGIAAYFIFFSGSVESKAKRMMNSGDYIGAKEILMAADPADYSRKTLVDCNIGLIKSAIEEKGTHGSNGKRIYTVLSDDIKVFFELTKDDELVLGQEMGLSAGSSAYVGSTDILNMYIDGSPEVFFERESSIEIYLYGRSVKSEDSGNGTVDLSNRNTVKVESLSSKMDSTVTGTSSLSSKEDFQKTTSTQVNRAVGAVNAILKQVGLDDITIKDLFSEE